MLEDVQTQKSTPEAAVEKSAPPAPASAWFALYSSERRTAIASYLFAIFLGLGITAYVFPRQAVFATDIRVRPVYQYDAAIGVTGQRYFDKDSWRWPLFRVKNLAAPEGTNVAFTDGVPLIELVVKLFRHFLPPDFHSIYVWLALCWVAQPIAAVFALRCAGERRFLPSVAVAVIVISMPTLLFRFGHAALSSHFVLLVALGLYFRITRSPSLRTILAADALILASLFINPYIMEMAIAVLVAAPLSLLIRRDRAWISTGVGIGAGVGVTAVAALLLGYGRAIPMGGYGVFSMNLLAPIYPALPFSGNLLDATGGQYEGYQYLGVGVILLVLMADFCLNARERLNLLRRHAGLVLACVGLTVLALSTKIYAGHRLLLDLPGPSFLVDLRASGRLFWPVTYSAIIVAAVIICRKLTPRWAVAVLLVFAALQYVESMPVRRQVRRMIRNRPGYSIDTALFRSLLASHSKLDVWPKFGCGANPGTPEFAHLYMLASEVAIPVNSTYVARFSTWPSCTLPQVPIAITDKTLWTFVPPWNAGMVSSVIDWRDICRQSGVLVVCAQDLRGNTSLPVPKLPNVPLGTTLSTAADAPGAQWLTSGWYGPEPWGTWAEGSTAYLTVNLQTPTKHGLVLKAWASGVPVPPATGQKVTVLADGHEVAVWDVKQGSQGEYDATIPPRAEATQSVILEFRIEHPISPHELGASEDDRKLGFGLGAFRVDEQSK